MPPEAQEVQRLVGRCWCCLNVVGDLHQLNNVFHLLIIKLAKHRWSLLALVWVPALAQCGFRLWLRCELRLWLRCGLRLWLRCGFRLWLRSGFRLWVQVQVLARVLVPALVLEWVPARAQAPALARVPVPPCRTTGAGSAVGCTQMLELAPLAQVGSVGGGPVTVRVPS